MIDTAVFAQWMGLFSDRFNRALAAPTQRMYFEILSRDLTTAEFVTGAEQCFARCTFWPSPDEIRATARPQRPQGSLELAGAEAFADLLRWNGASDLAIQARRRLSEPAYRAFLAVGGAGKFRLLTQVEEPFVRRAFVSAYAQAAHDAAEVAAACEATLRLGARREVGRIGESPSARRLSSGPERLGEISMAVPRGDA